MAERGAIVITWSGQRAGVPSTKGLEVFAKALGYYDELAKEGRISGYRVFASAQQSSGMLVIEGALPSLCEIQIDQGNLNLLAMASLVVNDIKAELCIGGSADDVTQYYMNGLQAATEAGLTTT